MAIAIFKTIIQCAVCFVMCIFKNFRSYFMPFKCGYTSVLNSHMRSHNKDITIKLFFVKVVTMDGIIIHCFSCDNKVCVDIINGTYLNLRYESN